MSKISYGLGQWRYSVRSVYTQETDRVILRSYNLRTRWEEKWGTPSPTGRCNRRQSEWRVRDLVVVRWFDKNRSRRKSVDIIRSRVVVRIILLCLWSGTCREVFRPFDRNVRLRKVRVFLQPSTSKRGWVRYDLSFYYDVIYSWSLVTETRVYRVRSRKRTVVHLSPFYILSRNPSEGVFRLTTYYKVRSKKGRDTLNLPPF